MALHAAKEEAGTLGLTGAEGARKIAKGSRIDVLRQWANEGREALGLPPTQAQPVKAEIEGNATLTGHITIAPSAFFMTTIDARIDSKINAFKSSGVTSTGTAGSTGRSSPDVAASE